MLARTGEEPERTPEGGPRPRHGPLYGGSSPRHAVADAGLVEDVGGVVRAFAKLAAEVLHHGQHRPRMPGVFQLAEVLVTREMLTGILERISRLRLAPG